MNTFTSGFLLWKLLKIVFKQSILNIKYYFLLLNFEMLKVKFWIEFQLNYLCILTPSIYLFLLFPFFEHYFLSIHLSFYFLFLIFLFCFISFFHFFLSFSLYLFFYHSTSFSLLLQSISSYLPSFHSTACKYSRFNKRDSILEEH